MEERLELDNWHSKEGLIHNISQVVSEFNLYRGLKPNKIFVMGPPASGKTTISESLAKAYGLNVLTVKNVLDELVLEEDEFANEIKGKI